MEDETEHLALLLSRWKTEGWTKGTASGPPARIDAVDTHEWLPGGRALLHTVDARVGDEKVEGAEIIAYDPARSAYVTQYFGTDGPAAYEATLSMEDGATVWRMRSQSNRFTGVFSQDGNTITGERRRGGSGRAPELAACRGRLAPRESRPPRGRRLARP